MDHEQKYAKALWQMKELYNRVKYLSSPEALLTTVTLENTFPELKESEEEELTEFEQELRYWIGQSLCNYENNGCVSDNMSDSVNIYLKDASKKLLDLARKKIYEDMKSLSKEE